MKNLKQFIWEELNAVQVLKAITQWLILITQLFIAYEVYQIIKLLK
jgi:hypothetical protein